MHAASDIYSLFIEVIIIIRNYMEKKHKVYSGLFNPLVNIYRSRDLLMQLTRRNIHARYKGTALGLLWWFTTPLMLLAVYTFVFSVVFKSRWGVDIGDSKTAFALIMFCGLVVFNILSESLNGAVGVIVGNPNYVKKVVFPLEILPVSSVLTALFLGLTWFAVLLAGVGLFMQKICLSIVCLPFILLILVLCCCGLAWLVAALGVYIRDLPHVVGILLQVLFFMTPIFYPIEMVPAAFRSILLLNPLTTIVESVRKVVIYDQWPDWGDLGVGFLISIVLFQVGYFVFMKVKRGFADVL